MNVKFSIILLLSFILPFMVLSQTIDYNTIILPSNAKNIGIEEKLVQLAWNNHPENRIEYNNLLIAEKSVKLNYADWLDIFSMSGNLNEFTINPESAPLNRNYFYPRYNFRASISLGMFLRVPTRTNISKLQVKNQEERINARKLQIRSEVLRRYQIYKLNKELLKIQTNFTDDAYSNFLIAEQQFKNGSITIEEYNLSLRTYNEQIVNKLQRQTDFEMAKIALEEMVGVNIDDILKEGN